MNPFSSLFVAPFVPDAAALAELRAAWGGLTRRGLKARVLIGPGKLMAFPTLLPAGACGALGRMLESQQFLPVATTGYRKDYQEGQDIGSWRASWYTPEFAEVLWARLKPLLASVRYLDEYCSTDWDGHPLWRPVGVNPLMRFIRYEAGGVLVPHYDAPFIESANRRTLMSLVLYLERGQPGHGAHPFAAEESPSGATEFLQDLQDHRPFGQRDFSDQPGLDPRTPVLFRQLPLAGNALVFDHRLLHRGAPVRRGRKLLLRTDILFEKVVA